MRGLEEGLAAIFCLRDAKPSAGRNCVASSVVQKGGRRDGTRSLGNIHHTHSILPDISSDRLVTSMYRSQLQHLSVPELCRYSGVALPAGTPEETALLGDVS